MAAVAPAGSVKAGVGFSRELRNDVLAGDSSLSLSLSLSVRVWKRPQVKEGGRYRVGLGEIEIDEDRTSSFRGDH